MFKKNLLALATGAALLVAAQTSSAATVAGGTLNYSITVNQACMATSTGRTFNPVDTMSLDVNGVAAGNVTVTCPTGVAYTVLIDGGMYPTANRNMFDGTGNFMAYHLRSEATGLPVGDLIATEPTYTSTATWASGISATGNANPQIHNLLADIVVSSSPFAGTYTDAVAVTIAY